MKKQRMRPLALIVMMLSAASHVAEAAPAPVPSSGHILVPGSYFVPEDQHISAIVIGISGVDLNLNGKTVRCDAAAEETVGIAADGGNDITIRNGKITGCVYGLSVLGSTSITLTGVDFTGVQFKGIRGDSETSGFQVRHSIFAAIGGYNRSGYAIGIDKVGSHCLIENNIFRDLHRQRGVPRAGEGTGIILSAGSSGCVIRKNLFENDRPGDHPEIGVWFGDESTAVFDENVIINFARAVAVYPSATITARDNRFWMRDSNEGSYGIGAQRGIVSSNLFIGYDKPIVGEVSKNGNLVVPLQK